MAKIRIMASEHAVRLVQELARASEIHGLESTEGWEPNRSKALDAMEKAKQDVLEYIEELENGRRS